MKKVQGYEDHPLKRIIGLGTVVFENYNFEEERTDMWPNPSDERNASKIQKSRKGP